MDCARALELLHGYLDNELDALHVREMEAHLETCASCHAEYEQELKLRSLLQAQAPRYSAPMQLRSRILSSVRTARRPRTLRQWVPMGWLQFGAALAAAVVLSSTVTYYSVVASNTDRVVDEVVASHARSLITNHPTDVASSDQHTVKPWFNGRVDFAPVVKDLSEQGFPLVGGRLDYVDGRPVAALLYRHRQHWISVFMWPDQSGRDTATRRFSRNGYSVEQWTSGGLRFYAVGDIAGPELGEFVAQLRGETLPR
jgi:mycothiol system anti-sigma-R factor